jgi:ferric-dicitrate binding protein FerR (iron transport regulator)
MRHKPWNERWLPSARHAAAPRRVSRRRGWRSALSRAAVAPVQGRVVSVQQDIAALQVRITRAESERDSWRVSGMQEKYLEAYSMVEALELQLDFLRRAARVQPS